MIDTALCNTTFIGNNSRCHGGNTEITFPGNLTLWFSGESVSYPNGENIQRVDLEPDILIDLTIKGIKSGKDVILERSIWFINKRK